ncbi:response regulator [Methylobrevis albus]|uniref:Response regulator n=1 Tax=Methylobrevis albus TaxID=2793297 RepID=A0A931I4X5_9HYPH|nr:response regulator [Methylobrevis albus]MBH0239997.1 response regulator [Methylobrevis albus]
MSHHSCYALPSSLLDIVVVDASKPMQMMMRSMLSGLKARRIRFFDFAEDALEAMLIEPPNLIITDWKLAGISGYQLLRTIRFRHMAPLSFVPVLFVSSDATRRVVERALLAGAQQFLVKPVSPAVLTDRVHRILRDSRQYQLTENGHYVITGVAEALDAQRVRAETLENARLFHDRSFRRIVSAQATVDRILQRPLPATGDEPAPATASPPPHGAPAASPPAAVEAVSADRKPATKKETKPAAKKEAQGQAAGTAARLPKPLPKPALRPARRRTHRTSSAFAAVRTGY